jgi:hypothetical protein
MTADSTWSKARAAAFAASRSLRCLQPKHACRLAPKRGPVVTSMGGGATTGVSFRFPLVFRIDSESRNDNLLHLIYTRNPDKSCKDSIKLYEDELRTPSFTD